jgi:glycosyltransferase involved in cell wall biosynthesis
MGDAPTRVAVVARSVYPLHGYGGLERHVYDLVRHLSSRGARVTLVTRPPLGSDHRVAELPAEHVWVPYLTFPFAGRRGTTILDRDTAYPLFGWRAGRVALDLVQRGQVDVVHGLGASVLGYAIARRRQPHLATAPLVLNPQGLEEFGATDTAHASLKRLAYIPLQAAVRACARGADAIIATDRALKPMVIRHLHVSPDDVPVIPNAIDVEACERLASVLDGQALRAVRGLAADEVVLLSVGRIEENKGFHVLAQALATLRARGFTAWRWVLVGDGPFRPRLEATIGRLGLASSVLLAGRADDAALHAWYEAATLFVHPTLYEGSSLVTLEAMAHRRAVVATRAGGLPDKVVPGSTGWLAPPGDPAALADALAAAVESRARLPSMGAAGRALVDRDFAWPSIAQQTLDLYGALRVRGAARVLTSRTAAHDGARRR